MDLDNNKDLVTIASRIEVDTFNDRFSNVIDPGMAGDYLNSAAGEKTILNVLSRNGSAVRELLR